MMTQAASWTTSCLCGLTVVSQHFTGSEAATHPTFRIEQHSTAIHKTHEPILPVPVLLPFHGRKQNRRAPRGGTWNISRRLIRGTCRLTHRPGYNGAGGRR